MANGQLQQRNNSDLALFFLNDMNLGESVIVSQITYRNIETAAGGYQFRGVAVVGGFDRDGNLGTGLGCGELLDVSFDPSPFNDAVLFSGGGFNHGVDSFTTMTEGETHVVQTDVSVANDEVTCSIDSATKWQRSTGLDLSGTGLAFATWGSGVDVDYLIVYTK